MANLKQETIKQFEGFGNENKITRGEYYRSSGFIKSQNGLTTAGTFSNLMNFSTLTDQGNDSSTGLAYARGFQVSNQNPTNYLYNASRNGAIIQSASGASSGSSAEYVHRSGQNRAYFHGLITDPKGRLLYHQDRYLGMFDGTGSTTNYITGTISVTNGSGAVVGTGTTFTAGMVGKLLKVTGDNKFYTISAYTSATSITINTYTGTTGSGKGYVINEQWLDTWKDFGAVVTLPNGNTPNCPMDIYEDTVIFGRGNVITTLNVLTDTITTDALPALSLPAGYSVDHIVSNSNGILIGGNVRSRGFLLLWDNLSDRAIAPWIWFPDSVLSVCKEGSNWIVITTRAVYRTTGYSTELIAEKILGSSTSSIISNVPRNSVVLENDLYFFGTGTTRALLRSVLYRMNLTNKLVQAFPRSTINQTSPSCAQMEYVGEANRLFLAINGVSTQIGTDYFSTAFAPDCSTYITNPVGLGVNQKVARRVKIRVRRNNAGMSSQAEAFSFKISMKIADFKHTLYAFAQTKVVSADTTHITVNGTTYPNIGQVGKEIEIVGDSGVDTNAGYSRNITSISGQGTATEVWTLDSAFPSIPPSAQNLNITPFQLVGRKTISVTNGEIEEIIFDVKNSIKSNKFMLKIDIEANTSFLPLEIEEPVFIYEDKGVL